MSGPIEKKLLWDALMAKIADQKKAKPPATIITITAIFDTSYDSCHNRWASLTLYSNYNSVSSVSDGAIRSESFSNCILNLPNALL